MKICVTGHRPNKLYGYNLSDPRWQRLKEQFKSILKENNCEEAITGMALGVLAMFPIGYQNRWRIYPDFETDKTYAEGDFDIRGFLFGYQIIFIMVRLIIDKECRRMYNRFMK